MGVRPPKKLATMVLYLAVESTGTNFWLRLGERIYYVLDALPTGGGLKNRVLRSLPS